MWSIQKYFKLYLSKISYVWDIGVYLGHTINMYGFCTHDVYGLLIRAIETFVRTFLQIFGVCMCVYQKAYILTPYIQYETP